MARREPLGGDGPLTPQEFLRLIPRGMRDYLRSPEEEAGGVTDWARFERWRAAWRSWCRAAGTSSLHVFRARSWAAMPRECPWELQAPTRIPNPRDPRWSEWLQR